MSNELPVYIGSTFFGIRITRFHVGISEQIRYFIQQRITEWDFDPTGERLIPTRNYTRYIEKESMLRIPIGYYDETVRLLEGLGVKVVEHFLPYPKARSIQVKSNPKWKDKPEQIPAIEYLSNENKARRGLQLQTGKGKTYISIKSLCNLQQATVIVAERLVDQWVAAVQEQTNITQDQLWVMQGSKSVLLLQDLPPEKYPSVFICSLSTLRPFIRGEEVYGDLGWTWEKFLYQYGIGVKIIDEVHLNFHGITHLDLMSNCANNIYLTATFSKSSSSAQKIFDWIYPQAMRFGAGVYDRYTETYGISYGINMGTRSFQTIHGYSHSKYESYMMRRVGHFRDFIQRVLVPTIQAYYLNTDHKAGKLLVFVGTIQFANAVKDALKEAIPGRVINTFLSGDDAAVLTKSDIILSTLGKSGVGRDIAGLRVVINTISLQSEPMIRQMFGRLRKIEGVVPTFIDLRNHCVYDHNRHFVERWNLLSSMSVKAEQFKLE